MMTVAYFALGCGCAFFGALAYADYAEKGRWLSAAAAVVFLIGGVGSLIVGLQHLG